MRKTLLILTALLWLIPKGYSATNPVLLEIQKGLEERISKVLKPYDENSLVIVHLEPETDHTDLPESPFVIDREVLDSAGLIKIKEVMITLLISEATLSPEVKKLVVAMGRELGTEPQIVVRPLGSPLRAKPIIEEPPKPVAAPPEIDRILLLSLVGFGFFLVLVQFWMVSRANKKLTRAIDVTGEKISRGLEFQPAFRERVRPPALPALAETGLITSERPFRAGSLSPEGLLALFCDCYWSSADGYANFIWKRLTIAKRRLLIAAAPYLADYVESLHEAPEENLNLEDAPFYLNPLRLWHLDNKALGELVKKTPALYGRLPELRKNALPLSATQRINFQQNSDKKIELKIDFSRLAASPLRRLREHFRISIPNVKEEEELLSWPSFTVEQKENIPSLAWLLDLPASVIEAKFQTLSAVELASAWVAPEKILTALQARISEKKSVLLQSYLRSQTASRDSEVFIELHRFAIEELKKMGTQAITNVAIIKKRAA